MRAEIVGIPPVPTGLTWASGTIEFSFDPNWSDGAGRGPGTISGILQPTTKDKFVVPGSLGALFVPATPTGTGVIRGPLMSMRWSLIDSQGREYRVDSVFPDSLLADAGNLFNVNAIGAVPTYVTSPGPAPVGVDLATGDARYVRFTSVATTGASGIASLATDAEALAGTVGTKSIVPTSLKAVLDSRFNVATLIALQGITAVQRTAGLVFANVVTLGAYRWDGVSTRVTDSLFVVRPADIASDATAGRWLLVASDVFATAAAPVLTRSSGVAGVPAFVSSPITGRTFNTVAYRLLYTITPGSVTFGVYLLTPPAGWLIQTFSVSAFVSATAFPIPSGFADPYGFFVVQFATVDPATLFVNLVLVKAP